MNCTLNGKKLGMTQVFDKGNGEAVPVTVIQIEDMVVFEKKTAEKDGYNALRAGYGKVEKPKRMNKAMKGHFKNEKKKTDLELKKNIVEVRVSREELDKVKIGDVINAEALKGAKFVDVSGISKGKGFQGVVKRYGFKGGPGGHGSMHHRAPGSVGASSYPSRVFKNQKMPGRMGGEKITAQNLKVVEIKDNYLLVMGNVPGAKNTAVSVAKAKKRSN